MDRRDAADPWVTVLGLGWLPCPALLGLVQGSRATGSGVCGTWLLISLQGSLALLLTGPQAVVLASGQLE